MRILFISTLNLATNPRLYKEIVLAVEAGYKVEVICFEFNNWSYAFNQELKSKIPSVKITSIPAGRKPLFSWASGVFLERGLRWTNHLFPLAGFFLSQAVSRRSMLLQKAIKKTKGDFDWVIGHNPGALYATFLAGKKFRCKTGFDIEDYHPGEGTDKNEQGLIKKLISHYLPRMDYVSFASPLMMERTIEDTGTKKDDWFVILNYFSAGDFVLNDQPAAGPLKLVWFSQNVNYKRGLEQIIPILRAYRDDIELTLIGNRKESFYKEFIEGNDYVKYLPPMDQQSLHRKMAEFDIGLAIEPGKDKNNFIALANKLITYFQSGLYILASDTPAHIDFFKKFPGNGLAVSLEKNNIPSVLGKLRQDIELIRQSRQKRFETGQQNSWETERVKLHDTWKNITTSGR